MTTEPSRQGRVLIAEDETIIRLDLRSLLEANGFEVCGEARDGVEAVELAESLAPDVILMDIKMPRLDGIEAARRILERRPVPIVMLTAFGHDDLVRRAVDTGVFGYLAKPFREHDVIPAVLAAQARHAEFAEVKLQAVVAPRGARGTQVDRARQGHPDGEGGPDRGRGLRSAAPGEPEVRPADEGDRRRGRGDARLGRMAGEPVEQSGDAGGRDANGRIRGAVVDAERVPVVEEHPPAGKHNLRTSPVRSYGASGPKIHSLERARTCSGRSLSRSARPSR